MQELEDRFEGVDFQDEIRPVLDRFTLRELSEKTGLSTGYLGEIRRGETVPNLEHWLTLQELMVCQSGLSTLIAVLYPPVGS